MTEVCLLFTPQNHICKELANNWIQNLSDEVAQISLLLEGMLNALPSSGPSTRREKNLRTQ